MATISKDNPVFTVMIHEKVTPGNIDDLVALSERMVSVFQKQPGFVSMSIHRSHDDTHLIVYVQWRRREDHEACRKSPAVMAAGMEFMQFMEMGRASFDICTYDVVASADAGEKEAS